MWRRGEDGKNHRRISDPGCLYEKEKAVEKKSGGGEPLRGKLGGGGKENSRVKGGV